MIYNKKNNNNDNNNKTTVLCISLAISLIAFSLLVPLNALAQNPPRFIVKVNQKVFVPGDTIVLYGRASENDALFVKLLDPANRTVRIENVLADANGSFTAQIFVWPQASRTFVYGTYNLEVSSSRFLQDKATIPITFAESAGPGAQPAQHILAAKLDSPTEISAGKPFRIFVQVTFDGALVNAATDEELASMLGSSHIHSGDTTINLSGKFQKLHEGIYYADVQLNKEGSYIIHAIAFHRGFLAHDSKVVSSGSSIGDVRQSVDALQQSVTKLERELDQTSRELNDTRTSVTESVNNARVAIKGDVENLESASGQINSLILPILALISVIIALQISLFARIRASFK